MDQVNFALVGFDSVRLLIPQRAIATIEMIDSLERETDVANAIGSLSAAGKRWPVYGLASDFSLLGQCPESSKYCVAFDIEGRPAFALTCDEVSSLTLASNDEVAPIQECMRYPGSPLEGLLMRDGGVMFCSSEEAMFQFLSMDVAA